MQLERRLRRALGRTQVSRDCIDKKRRDASPPHLRVPLARFRVSSLDSPLPYLNSVHRIRPDQLGTAGVGDSDALTSSSSRPSSLSSAFSLFSPTATLEPKEGMFSTYTLPPLQNLTGSLPSSYLESLSQAARRPLSFPVTSFVARQC